MRLALIGGGGFRVPLVYRALQADTSPGRVTEVRLFDTDASRLGVIAAVLEEMRRAVPGGPDVKVTRDLTTALTGADFVFSAMRVGGTGGRALDERISLRHRVIGQETVGVGGISYALRGIPATLHLAEQIKRHAPGAWVINFTNPAGVITEVMQRHLGGQAIGICDSPVGLARRVAHTLQRAGLIAGDLPAPGTGADRIHIEYAGLNHLGWLTGLLVDGSDVLPLLLARADLLETFEEGRLFGAPLVQALGAVPNEYLHFYYYAREDLAVDLASPQTRGTYLEAQQAAFYQRAQGLSTGALELWERTRRDRETTYLATNREAVGGFERDAADLEAGGYDQVALAIMHAIANDQPAELILNVANGGALPDLDDSAVVEVPCRVDRSGATPLPGSALPEHGRGLVVNAKYVERLTMDAAISHSRDSALLALTHHPLVDSFAVAERLLDDLVQGFDELAYLR